MVDIVYFMQANPIFTYKTQNGVLQIYENNPRIPLWVMGYDNWLNRVNRGGDSDGSVYGTGSNTVVTERGQVRYNIKCKPDAGEGSGNHQINLKRGWSDSPDDFVNIEQTGYIDVTDLATGDDNQDNTCYGPSGRHHGSGGLTGCKGSTYKGSLHANNGKNRMAKENYHVDYTYVGWDEGPKGVMDVVKQMNGQNKRVGFKWVNFKVGDYRRLEIWVDIGGAIGYNEQPKNEWQLIRVHEDHSDMLEKMGECKCDNKRQAILWGGPYCTYRWDDKIERDPTTAKLSLATIQEMSPPSTFHNVGNKVTANT